MPDYHFLKYAFTKTWIILAPRRAKRPNETINLHIECPFCPGRENDEEELFRIGGKYPDDEWNVRVLRNKFPFAPNHEVIVHSQDHHKSFDELPLKQAELIIETYHNRYNMNQYYGQVYIFNNHGIDGGESLPHPHTQLVVVPDQVQIDIPRLEIFTSSSLFPKTQDINGTQQNELKPFIIKDFFISCPIMSQWPDEVWIVPQNRGKTFGQSSEEERKQLAYIMKRTLRLLDERHGDEFPYNFYIYPGADWYVRIIPRVKSLGGFEIGTNMYINTQDPEETLEFIKLHFNKNENEPIQEAYKARYHKSL